MSIANPDLEKFGTNNFIYAYEMDSLKKNQTGLQLRGVYEIYVNF